MPRKSQQMTIQEMPGQQYPDLASAQMAARDALACDLADTIQQLLVAGRLANINGRISTLER